MKIKIASNPYEQKITYSKYDEQTGEYNQITSADSSTSKLLSSDFVKCFFPFKAKDILNQLVDEYAIKGKLDVVFEGASDEYAELLEVKEIEQKFSDVQITKGERYLEDGRDVINEINEIFKIVEPIVRDSVPNNESINKNLKKYSDASNDIIPICVIGTTSVGKSTFINSLIGAEYLPQDNGRCTAKIYKIMKSKDTDRAFVKFDYDEETIIIYFKSDYEITGNLSNEFKEELSEILNSDANITLSKKITNLLKYLNTYNEIHETKSISDLIELEVPFNSKVFEKSNNPFVIFDTPGSNDAEHAKDLELLKQQMKDLTNGLPIFISDYNGLTTTDNDRLIEELQSINELDQRFTILVVNKADDSMDPSVPWGKTEELMEKSKYIPKKLATKGLQGIYFISSIMGLGYKNNGSFIAEKNSRIYKNNVNVFDGSSTEFTPFNLYKFNIIPSQHKIKFESNIPAEINPIYLNSGLFSIENEIEIYANKYSAYNKCQQSRLFLEKIFNETEEEIEKQTEVIRIQNDQMKSNFDTEKQKLIDSMDTQISEKKLEFNETRTTQVNNILDKNEEFFDKIKLKEIEEDIYKNFVKEFSIDDTKEKLNESKQNTSNTFKDDISTIKDDFINQIKNQSSFKNVLQSLSENIEKAFENLSENVKEDKENKRKLNKGKLRAEANSYKKALMQFKEMYDKVALNKQENIFSESKTYWESKSESLKNDLIKIVVLSTALADEQKELLKEIIGKYEPIILEKSPMKDLENNKYKSFLSKRINIAKLSTSFNKLMRSSVNSLYEKTMREHSQVFETWVQNLYDVIVLNIGGMNPTLKLYLDKINELTERKQQLENNCEILKEQTSLIIDLISWKEL